MIRTPSLRGQGGRRGIAILLAMFLLLVASAVAVSVAYESSVEYAVNAQAVHRVQAYYAARAGVELSLFRLSLYQNLRNSFGQNLSPSQAQLLDMIWSFPFEWPPPDLPDMTRVDREMIQEVVSRSLMKARYKAVIFEEGSKIDLNDFASPSESIRKVTQARLLEIFEEKKISDEAFRKRHADTDFSKLVGHISDWVTSGSQSANGGDKSSHYSQRKNTEGLPPRRWFRTLGEVRMIGMPEEIFALIEKHATLAGSKSVNPNTASDATLMSLDRSITKEVLVKFREQLASSSGQIQNDETTKECSKAFLAAMQTAGARINESSFQVPMQCSPSVGFRIVSQGFFAEPRRPRREIQAIVWDQRTATERTANAIAKDSEKSRQADTSKPGPGASPGVTLPGNTSSNALPRIIYWSEK